MKSLIIFSTIFASIIVITISNIHLDKVEAYKQKQKDEIIILKFQQQKHLISVYMDEYYRLANVLEKCKHCQSSYFVDENKNIFEE